MSSEINISDTKDVQLSDFQKWVLFYFIKNKDAVVSAELLLDNMCLTAVLDLDIDNAEKALKNLTVLGLISFSPGTGSKVIAIAEVRGLTIPPLPTGYKGTLKGRLYLKQKIIYPLVLAKREEKIKEIITYLNTQPSDNQLVNDLKEILQEKDQNKMMAKIADIALTQLVPLLNWFNRIQEKFFGST